MHFVGASKTLYKKIFAMALTCILIDKPVKLSFNLFCSDSAIASKNNFTAIANYPLAYLAIKNNIS